MIRSPFPLRWATVFRWTVRAIIGPRCEQSEFYSTQVKLTARIRAPQWDSEWASTAWIRCTHDDGSPPGQHERDFSTCSPEATHWRRKSLRLHLDIFSVVRDRCCKCGASLSWHWVSLCSVCRKGRVELRGGLRPLGADGGCSCFYSSLEIGVKPSSLLPLNPCSCE